MQKIVLNKKQWGFILTIWLVVQAFFLYTNGIIATGESEKYIHLSSQLADGNWKLPVNFYFYLGYILVHLLIKMIGLSYKWMYLVQLVVAALAMICFVKILLLSVRNRATVVVIAILFAICPFFQSWTSFLYTDIMFASLVIICIYYLIISFTYPTVNNNRILIFLLLVLPFFRPIGLLFIPVAIFFWITHTTKKKRSSNIIFFSGYFILLLMYAWYCMNYASDFFYPNHNSEANIICGYPSDLTKYIKHPYDPDRSMIYFFVSNPQMSARLFLNRLFKSFWMTRPYFSNLHNAFLTVFLVPCYSLALISAFAILRRQTSTYLYLLFGLFVFILPMLVFCADWSNRFMLPPLVFIFILMALGLDSIIYQKPISKT